MSAAPLLELRNICVSYGKIEVVHNVSLTMAAGQIVTVIGANGAGKTTLLNAAMGLLASRGDIVMNGELQRDHLTEERVAAGMCLVPEKRELFASMSVEDNLRLGAYALPKAKRAPGLEEVYALFPRLKERQAQLAGTLSGGERQMLAMGRALMSKPRLLMLDEPSLGLAPKIVQDIFHIITGLRARGVSILLVEQNARAALQVADYGYVMELGEIAFEGPANVLAADPKVTEIYLGLGGAKDGGAKDGGGSK